MKQLNYNHLFYFYNVAREGGVHKAAEKLHITPQTVSGQISSMEKYLGYELFNRVEKRLVLNEMGSIAFRYAEEIFSLGTELTEVLSTKEIRAELPFNVGIIDVVPKIFAYHLLQACFSLERSVHLSAREGSFEYLLSEFSLNKLDLIVSDRQVPPVLAMKANSQVIAESGFTFFAAKNHPVFSGKAFPQCLDEAPIIVPGDKSMQKSLVLSWLNNQSIHPRIVAEFDDSALMKLFGRQGHGAFFAPTLIEAFITAQFDVDILGRTDEVKSQFFAITPQRRTIHPLTRTLLDRGKSLSQQHLSGY